ncbi:TRAP transporter permease [Ponticoccus alexandrii]|nr:TRAP transporter fused permease subunit [Ponticoccus alexandrii]
MVAIWTVATSALAIGLGLFHLYVAYFGTPEPRSFRSSHLFVILVLGILLNPLWRDKPGPGKGHAPSSARAVAGRAVDATLLTLCVAIQAYLLVDIDSFLSRVGRPNPTDILVGFATLALVLELTRRTVGWPMVLVAAFFATHALFAPYFPGFLNGPPASQRKFIDILIMGQEGVYGQPLHVAATYIILFVIFGALLNKAGASRVFVDLATALTGRLHGGPAKAAIVGSAFLGMVSGSAVANVVTTGAVSIPMMKRLGFKAKFAGAVEACASSGGQITPPVMGAAAFIMAEFLQVSYVTILTAALIPAILYFATVYFMVDMEARRLELPLMEAADCPRVRDVLKEGWAPLMSLVALIGLLMIGYTPMFAAFWTILALSVIVMLRQRNRLSPQDWFAGLEEGVRIAVPVTIACACAGIIIGSIFLSGLGLKFTNLVVVLADGNLFIMLCLAGVAGIVLGMGMTTTAVYITLAALLVPALVASGVEPMAAHFFALYYGVVSSITPPVALASFAAAGLAGAGPMETAVESARVGVTKYIAPFLFVYNPALLFQGPLYLTALSFAVNLAGLWALSACLSGYAGGRLGPVARGGIGLSGALLLVPPGAVILPGLSGYAFILAGAAGVILLMTLRPGRLHNVTEV